MGGFLRHSARNFYKIGLTLIALGIVFYVLIEFRLWSMEWTEYFTKVGKLEEIIFISLIVAGASLIVLKAFHVFLSLQSRS